jgi:hypothetical protein
MILGFAGKEQPNPVKRIGKSWGMETMIRAVFWDNDGVLVDTEKLYFQATLELLLPAGVMLTPELFKRISLTEGRSAFDLADTSILPSDPWGN